jgi:MFS family permease
MTMVNKNFSLVENIKNTLRALKHRNFRLFFLGQGISLLGTWFQQIAMSWLVYRLTNSPLWLGFIGFTGQIPLLFIPPFAGVLSDRLDKRKILIVTQSLAMLQALVLAILVMSGSIHVWHIIVLSLFLGIVNGFDVPARQSFFVEMVERREDLSNAIALNSSLFNGARFIGPSIGGIFIAAFGEGMCFLVNAVSFIAVIIALFLINTKIIKVHDVRKRVMHELKEGFDYTFGIAPVKVIIFLIGLSSIAVMPYVTVLPVFAKLVLKGGPRTFGFLMACVGAGALTGAIYLASRRSVVGLSRILSAATFVFGTGLVVLSFTDNPIFSMIVIYVASIGMMLQIASCNTIIQSLVDDDKRGRVMSFYAMSFIGLGPFGNLLTGTLTKVIGVRHAITFAGISSLIGAIVFAINLPRLNKAIRPIYVKKGIIKPGEAGIAPVPD